MNPRIFNEATRHQEVIVFQYDKIISDLISVVFETSTRSLYMEQPVARDRVTGPPQSEPSWADVFQKK